VQGPLWSFSCPNHMGEMTIPCSHLPTPSGVPSSQQRLSVLWSLRCVAGQVAKGFLRARVLGADTWACPWDCGSER
jgi:hypothetical protein